MNISEANEKEQAVAKSDTREQSRTVLVDHKPAKIDPKAADLRSLREQR